MLSDLDVQVRDVNAACKAIKSTSSPSATAPADIELIASKLFVSNITGTVMVGSCSLLSLLC